MTTRGTHTPEEYEKRHVSDSFHHYLASQQIISIMCAVAFLGLISTLFDQGLEGRFVVDVAFRVDLFDVFVVLLTVAELCLVTALIGFHSTATAVYLEWGIFFPTQNLNRRIASFALTIGIYSVQIALSVALVMSGHIFAAAINVPALIAWPFLIRRVTRHTSPNSSLGT